MKIGITGSHGTGKTTLLDEIEGVEGVEKITEVARRIIKEIGCNPQDMSVEDRMYFQDKCFTTQTHEEVKKRSFISDRTVLDILAYSQDLPKAFYDRMKEGVDRWMKYCNYDIIFYTPIEFDMEDDGVRVTDEAYRNVIDDRIIELLIEYGVPYITITGTVQERIQKMNQSIKNSQK